MSTEEEWKQMWYVFDSQKEDKVAKADFLHIVRALGRMYSEQEIKTLTADIPDPVALDDFLKFMQQPYTAPTQKELWEALDFLGGRSGFVRQSDILTFLTTLGEQMSREEAQNVLNNVKVDDEGRISVDDLCRYLSTPVPSMMPQIMELQAQLAAAKT
uniref:Calmodulin n=1 Tax=Eutreptiella gymnastica TaxID=73025 RepID=A0A7S1NHQ9_9EUGL